MALNKCQRMALENRKTEKLLASVGYTALKKSGMRPLPPDFPNLKVVQNVAPTSDKAGNGLASPPLHPDAKQFPVGLSHKQGHMLIGKFDDLQYMGGKKT